MHAEPLGDLSHVVRAIRREGLNHRYILVREHGFSSTGLFGKAHRRIHTQEFSHPCFCSGFAVAGAEFKGVQEKRYGESELSQATL